MSKLSGAGRGVGVPVRIPREDKPLLIDDLRREYNDPRLLASIRQNHLTRDSAFPKLGTGVRSEANRLILLPLESRIVKIERLEDKVHLRNQFAIRLRLYKTCPKSLTSTGAVVVLEAQALADHSILYPTTLFALCSGGPFFSFRATPTVIGRISRATV